MLHTIKTRNFIWYNLIKPTARDLENLRQNFNFHPLDLEASRLDRHSQRPQISEYEKYIFLILLFPIYRRRRRDIKPAEIDFFLGENYLITIHNNELEPLKKLFNLNKDHLPSSEQFSQNNNSEFLYEILNQLFLYCFPMLDHISLDIANIENNIWQGQEKEMTEEILIIQRNIINFRKIMQAHKNVIKKIVASRNHLIAENIKKYFFSIVEQSKDIWDILENQKDTIYALHHTNESLISFKLNDIMKTLTIFSVIVFPLTLLAALFSMNTINMPLSNHPYGFWIIISIMAGGVFLMFAYFKHKKWI